VEPLYDPKDVEARWQRTWEDEGLYRAEPDPSHEPYVICFPPPNVTGALHLGHALNASTQDVLVRFHRMRGFNTHWQPGYDHASISVETVMIRELAKEGLTREDLGREAYIERTWEWLRLYGGLIIDQLKSLGASLDYSRMRFTMDDAYVRAVYRFFVHLYGKGYVYRGHRIINWCPVCASSISDLEVRHHDVDDTLYRIRYPLADGSGHIAIATVRPPTMLADVAVAVHPEDERYRDLVGREAIVPVLGRRVPIVADERVEPGFGTGAVKITPGHDPMDFDIGADHGLESPMVIGLDGRMNEIAGAYAGLTQDEANERIVALLREQGLLEAEEPYRHSVGHCDRTKNRVEPLISLQWFCDMKELAAPAIEAIRGGRIRYTPAAQADVSLSYLENIRPWCISRQLWWGQQIPVWYCPEGHVTVGEATPAACGECGSAELEQDPDVLDTWFSSALWPFATLGWPDETPELAAWYPGAAVSTARDIIFLWIARMVMAGYELMGDLPYRDVIIHSLVHAPGGKRMSKSLGTGLAPDQVIAQHGADATRYGMLKMSSTQDVSFSTGMIEEGRKLANKLWNVSRLILANAGDARPEARPQTLEERWMIARLDRAHAEITERLAEFDFAGIANLLYRLTFDEFCDWYAEASKQRLYDGDADAQATALALLERLLAYLHLVMPHVTEEIWSSLPARESRLMVAPWPEWDGTQAGAQPPFERIRNAAEMFRRSGVRVPLDGEEARIFESVVKPERVKANGNVGAELERLRKEIARAEGMLANERFTSKAKPEVVEAEREKLERYRRELDALGG